MADTYGTCPHSALTDERLDGDAGPARAGLALVVLRADDWMLFEGDAAEFARQSGCSEKWVAETFEELERRELVEFYFAPGRRRRVGHVIGGLAWSGHCNRRAFESQRLDSVYPDKDGQIIPGRSSRKAEANAPQPAANEPASRRKENGKKPASNRQANGKSAASQRQSTASARQHRREEKRGEEKRGEERSSLRSERGASSAPPLPSPSGSTDARAIESPEKGGPEPALGGAGRAPEVQESWPVYDLAELRAEEEQRESQRSRRPKPLSPEDEANRRAALRAQLAAMVAEEAVAP